MEAMSPRLVVLLLQDNEEDDPGPNDLRKVGTVGVIRQMAKVGGGINVIIEGMARVRADIAAAADEKRLESLLAAVDVRLRGDEPAIAKFRALRAMYEPYVQALSSFLIMSLPEWVPPEDAPDSWHTMT